MTSAPVLTASVKRAMDALAADLTRVFGSRFVALVAYGANTSVAFTTTLLADDLDALGALVHTWHHEGLMTPLVMTPDELRRSADSFPLEYQAMIDHHTVIAGRDPFSGMTIGTEVLRRACDTHARSHVIHLRQGWLQAGGDADKLAELVRHSAPPLRALLTSVARLLGVTAHDPTSLAAFAERTIGLPADLIGSILALETQPEASRQLVSRLGEYLAAADRLWTFVDSWRST